MSKVSALWSIATSLYISLVFFAAVGIVVGYFVFFSVYPGKPKIGIIDIPFVGITDDTAFIITAFLDYARRNDDIKGVVIKLNSPGGFAAASEQLYLETRKLREEKPVVIAMNDLVASGAFMMSMGANYTYAKSGSAVGNVGAFIVFPGPLIPRRPDERIISTGPQKLTAGASRRDSLRVLDQLKENFYQMVRTERGEKLRMSREELMAARIYNGSEAVRLVDAIGSDAVAIEKAANLAGISNYELLDVSVEVFRIFNEQFVRINEPLFSLFPSAENEPGLVDMRTLLASSGGSADSAHPLSPVTSMDTLRRLYLPSGISELTAGLPPDLPVDINAPRAYYLYVGPTE